MDADVVVIGGTAGIGHGIAAAYLERGARVAIAGRDRARAAAVALELGGQARGFELDLCDPATIADSLRDLGPVDRLIVTAVERDVNSVRDYDVDRAIRLTTMKVVGYTAVVHELAERLRPGASILLFGGLAKDKPYPGSTTVTTVNGAISAMVRTLALELAPIRTNAIHPGIVGDSPYWAEKSEALANVIEHTPTRQLVRTSDVVDASLFLLENQAMNGVNLDIDGGWLLL